MKQQPRRLVATLGIFTLAAAGFTYLAGQSVAAGTQSASLAVSATVSNNCTISTAAVSFGSYDPVVTHASANLDGSGTVTIACTKGSVTPVDLNLGSNASGSTRRMAAAGEFLTYELYQDASHSTVWGSGASAMTPSAAANKNSRDFTVYGRVASAQDVPAGSYSDSVTATVNF